MFDALTSERPYKQAFSLEKALKIMAEGHGSHFDPNLFDRFTVMAEALDRRYAGREDEGLQQELAQDTARYFAAAREQLLC